MRQLPLALAVPWSPTFNLLARFPRMGGLIRKRPLVRKLLHSPFLVYYQVREAKRKIEVLHIRHGARKPPKSELRPKRD
jgi:plasmid stabilization system protein ParE